MQPFAPSSSSWRRAGMTSVLLTLSVGCSSAYVPVQSPRLSFAIENGHAIYWRDGQKFDGGLFGGSIEEAVRGNPHSEEYARQYKTGTEAGFGLMLGGLGAVIGGSAVAMAEDGRGNVGGPALTGLGLMGVGLVSYLVGAIVALNAAPHLWDAINAYNDAPAPGS